ncbi:MAG: DegT/DnrJ/EryC1/StrS family aminotransferase [Deltaproteobacteria bacterium HGW-Deltaproteobacteria-13]|jgi:dTDP-4-amino-4,6-dideoxygalactose transaminase|nr:MAG: DegT/DnrJ/EryC1/StrS family aminotransferase [Deltaproteobacteria bacterium HGW-Deltaproteobacteria-13]
MIKLIKPYISFDEVETEFREIFENGCFTRGKHVAAFAEQIKAYTGAHHAFLTTSATTALWMCMRLLGIGNGDEVIVSDFSFPATANIVEDVGARPVFADVSMDTFNMLPEELERKITSKTKAVIFVDALGNPSGIHTIKKICRDRGIPLIEDAACAIGSSENSIRCGNLADLTCFSFHPRKLLTTGEGGAITTNNDDWAKRLAIKLAHGAVTQNGKFDFVDYGYNFRLSELQAVMGIKQLKKLDAIVQDRSRIRDAYKLELEAMGFRSQQVSKNVMHNVQSLVFRVPEGLDRDRLITDLKNQDIESTLGTYCLSGLNYYKQKYSDIRQNSRSLQEQTITLPCFHNVNTMQVCKAIRKTFKIKSAK